MFRTYSVAICALISCFAIWLVEDRSQQTAEVQKTADVQPLKYLLYEPADAADSEAGKRWPLVVFLHGGGEGGDDLETVKKHGLPKLIEAGQDFPFFVVSPQNPSKTQFWDDQQLIRLVDEIASSHPIDPSRIYLTGLSRGAFGAWRLAIQNPDRFAALVPISGGGPLPYVKRIKDLPVWVFHGEKDTVIPVNESRRLVEELKNSGSNVKFTTYPDASHDAWTETYENPDLYEWMLQQKK